jgi:hypothetical protein
MGTIAWQYGQVGEWNSTTDGREPPTTTESKFPESRTTTADDAGVGVGVGVEGPEPPPPHPPARSTTAAATNLRLKPSISS